MTLLHRISRCLTFAVVAEDFLMFNVRRFCISFPNLMTMFKVNVVAYRISLSLT